MISEISKGNKKSFSYNGSNKCVYNVVKMVSWCDYDHAITTLLDSNASVGDNHSNAEANNNSLIKLDSLNGEGNLAKEVGED